MLQLRLGSAPVTGRSLAVRNVPVASRRVASQQRVVSASAYATEEQQQQKLAPLPHGFHQYETMMILKPSLNDEERDRELAKFEAYLNKEGCYDIVSLVRGRHRLAYPIKREEEGTFVLYQYVGRRQNARSVQLLLSNPEAGAEDTVLRHCTVCLR